MVRINSKQRDLTHFRIETSIGKGGFGKVNCVTHMPTGRMYAMKTLNKAACFEVDSGVQQVFNELEILTKYHHPTLCNAHYAFQDDDNLYLVMDLALGGDLKFQLAAYSTFNEKDTKYFIASMVLAVQYLHSLKILHRDVKPANMLMQTEGHILLTDFGLSTHISKLTTTEISGTDGYIAPEMYQRRISPQKTDNELLMMASDWYALGVCMYQFGMGERPWKKTRDMCTNHPEYKIPIERITNNGRFTPDFIDFFTKITHPVAEERLGTKGGAEEVMGHPWLADYDFEGLQRRKIEPPFHPDITKKNVDRRISVMDLEEQLVGFKADVPKVDKSKQVMFENYYLNTELTESDLEFISQQKSCMACSMM